jgi:hypothetical protein
MLAQRIGEHGMESDRAILRAIWGKKPTARLFSILTDKVDKSGVSGAESALVALAQLRSKKAVTAVAKHGFARKEKDVIRRTAGILIGGIRTDHAMREFIKRGFKEETHDEKSGQKEDTRIGILQEYLRETAEGAKRTDVFARTPLSLFGSRNRSGMTVKDANTEATARSLRALTKYGAKSANAGIAKNAIMTLIAMETGEAFPALAKYGLSHPDLSVVHHTIEALRRMDDKRAMLVLMKALKHKNTRAAWGSAIALGEMGNAEAVPTLIQALKHKKWVVAKESAVALGEIKDPKAVPALIKALEHEHPLVVENSARALGKIGDKRALPHLMMHADNPYEKVRSEVKGAIRKIRGARHA